jgi:phosphomannomutase
MREISLAKKLLWLTVGSTFITVLVLSSVLWWQLSSSNQELALKSEEYIVAEVEEKLQGRGRVLLRPSGTEPLLRVMVEGEQEEEVQRLAEEIAELVTQIAG